MSRRDISIGDLIAGFVDRSADRGGVQWPRAGDSKAAGVETDVHICDAIDATYLLRHRRDTVLADHPRDDVLTDGGGVPHV
jgi:hypothetical protein